MQWSNPERRSSDGRTLSQIPNEIYMHVIDYIKCGALGGLYNDPLVRRDLRNLSAVCRFFCAATASWLFQSICFDGLCPASESRTSGFCRKLLANDQAAQLMAQYVTKCEFLSWETVSKNSWTRKEFMSMYTEALIHMPNIAELRLTRTEITKGLLKSIAVLPKLSRLKVANCFYAEDVRTKHRKKLSLLKLKSVSFDRGTPNDFIQFINLDTVQLLKVERLPFPSQSATNHGLLPLESLDCRLLEAEATADVEAFFSRTPALKALRFGTFNVAHLPAFQGNKPLFPQLEIVEGPEPFVNCISPGRPVKSALLLGRGAWSIDGLRHTTCPISYISLHGDVYAQLPLWQHFPDLEILQVRLEIFSESRVEIFINAWPKHPNLKSLKITAISGNVDLALQRRLLLFLVVHFPALRHCYFTDYIEWSYSESDGIWKPAVILQEELNILSTHEANIEGQAGSECFSRLEVFKKEVDTTDYATLISRNQRRRDVIYTGT